MKKIFTIMIGCAAFFASSATMAENAFSKLGDIPDKFRFVIIADPQVGAEGNKSKVAYNAMKETEAIASEVNNMARKADFVVHLGDLVNTFTPESEANYRRLAGLFNPHNILVHGNHDTYPPYKSYLKLQKDVTGVDLPYYSFDAGQWHFIVTPCNLNGITPAERKTEKAMLEWLEKDLAENSHRPTIFFNHLPLMPQGLSQTEFYHFPLILRQKLINLITKHGNVKYYLNGHVHNGLQTSEKTSWTYKGTTFFTAPSIIQPRPFGEDFPGFEEGIDRGGFYLVVDIDRTEVKLTGRMSRVSKEHVFSKKPQEYIDEQHPRWFNTMGNLPATPKLDNGDFSFDSKLSGWNRPHRYVHSTDPFFVAEHGFFGERMAARLMVKSPAESIWVKDEYNELSQTVAVSSNKPVVIGGDYYIPEQIKQGGAYVTALLYNGTDFKGLMMFHLGDEEEKLNYVARSYGYGITGVQQNWLYFQRLGEKKKAMFFPLPKDTGKWHSFSANLTDLYDRGHTAGAFQNLGVDKVIFSAGVWNYTRTFPNKAEVYYSNLILENGELSSQINGKSIEVDSSTFTCKFGQGHDDQLTEHSLSQSPIRKKGNLITNGNFSKLQFGRPIGWEKARNLEMISVDTKGFLSAPAAIHLSDSNPQKEQTSNGWINSRKIGVEENATYDVSWSWKYDKARNVALIVSFWDRNQKYIGQTPFPAAGSSNGWKTENKSVKAPEGARLMKIIFASNGNGIGNVTLDDVSVTYSEKNH
jgi:3',5'-cyclic AMP phosphodiesterase CpdA